MGFLFLLTIFAYLTGLVIILVILRLITGSNKTVAIIGVLLIIAPFWRYILVSAVFHFYEKTPLQAIHKTIEKPESVYWEDNVWSGFNEYYTKAMIECYLDGINLKMLALNGEDGKIYLYKAEADDYSKSKAMLPELKRRQKIIDDLRAESKRIREEEKTKGDYDWVKHREQFGPIIGKAETAKVPFSKAYKKQLDKEVESIYQRPKIFTSAKELPPMNYKVEFNKVPVVPSFLKSLIIADKITIIDNKTDELIAFSKRYLAYSGWVSNFSGNLPKFDGVLGYYSVYKFDNKILFQYAKNKGRDGGRGSQLLYKRL